MQARFKVGLVIGVIGLVLNICVSATVGLYSLIFFLVAGALAGYFAARQESQSTRLAGAQAGAISGTIAGALLLAGPVVGDLGISLLMQSQSSGSSLAIGMVPFTSSGESGEDGFNDVFVLLGPVLAALSGTVVGYLATAWAAPRQKQ